MEFYKQFYNLSLEDRVCKSNHIKDIYYPKLPLLIDRLQKSDPLIKKNKFLVEPDLYFHEFMIIIRKYIAIKPNQALFLLYNNSPIPMNQTMGEWYHQHPSEDGFINLIYCVESTFGSK
jgi:hypothetical protein